MSRSSRQRISGQIHRQSSEQSQPDLIHVESLSLTPRDSPLNSEAFLQVKAVLSKVQHLTLPAAIRSAHHEFCAVLQVTADSTLDPPSTIFQAGLVTVPDDYGVHVTAEGLSIQTLQPPAPDAAQAAAGRTRRARAALAARTQQLHGPLPMPPRKQLPRPASPSSEQLTGSCFACHLMPRMSMHQTCTFVA